VRACVCAIRTEPPTPYLSSRTPACNTHLSTCLVTSPPSRRGRSRSRCRWRSGLRGPAGRWWLFDSGSLVGLGAPAYLSAASELLTSKKRQALERLGARAPPQRAAEVDGRSSNAACWLFGAGCARCGRLRTTNAKQQWRLGRGSLCPLAFQGTEDEARKAVTKAVGARGCAGGGLCVFVCLCVLLLCCLLCVVRVVLVVIL
jgi:hypothetical protein